MKLIIKTIKGEVFHVEVEPTDKISDVKEKLNAEKGFEVGLQKLILRGKNTEDNSTLADLGVKEGDFMVVMVSKKPAGQAQAQTQPTTQATQPTEQKPESTTGTAMQIEQPQGTQSQSQSQSATTGDSLLFGDQLNNVQ
jgi:UV excision repair protein RAD23